MGLISGFVTFIKTGNPLFFKSRCQIWSELIQIHQHHQSHQYHGTMFQLSLTRMNNLHDFLLEEVEV